MMTNNITTTPMLKSAACRIRALAGRHGPITLIVLVLVTLGGAIWWLLYCDGWEWIRAGATKMEMETESNGTTLHNITETESNGTTLHKIIIGIFGFVALLLGWWRSSTAQKQTDTALRQAETAERRLLNERYQKGADMLGHETLATRFGGIMALERLAQEHAQEHMKDYHVQIMNLLCAFARKPTKDDELDEDRRCRSDVELAVQTIGKRRDTEIQFEREKEWKVDLTYVHLMDAVLKNANLADANLADANLADADLTGADLTGADLTGADLTAADLTGANLTFADLTGAQGLTQEQLDIAKIDQNGNPPNLTNAFCAYTGNPLIWNG